MKTLNDYIDDILVKDATFRYQMLGRLKSDCDYFINRGRNAKHLWAGNISDQVNIMDAIFNSFKEDEKPTWISQDDIDKYGFRMFNAYQRECLADDMYGLFSSYDPYYFKECDDFIFGRDLVIERLSNEILSKPDELIAEIQKMTASLDNTCEFCKDARGIIRGIKKLSQVC